MKIIEMSLKNVKMDETRFRENQKLAKGQTGKASGGENDSGA